MVPACFIKTISYLAPLTPAIITLKQIIDEKISLLEEQIKPTNNPELNSTFRVQIDPIRSTAQDMEKVEETIALKKYVLKNCKDILATDTFLAELEALGWCSLLSSRP